LAARGDTSWVELPIGKGPELEGTCGASGRGGARGGGVLTGQGPEESSIGACITEEEDDGAGVVVAVLYDGRWLGDMLGSKVLCGRTGTSTSVLEVGQRRAHRRSGSACGEAEAVRSRGGAKRGATRRKWAWLR
jgi:hypothetical protein